MTKNFADIKNLNPQKVGLGAGSFPIGMPFFWASATPPNELLDEWSDQVFLKWNGATFSATQYPKLAAIIPSLRLTESRGEFPRIWDDGRGVDNGRALLTAQSDTIQNITGSIGRLQLFQDTTYTGPFRPSNSKQVSGLSEISSGGNAATTWSFDASLSARTSTETRPRNIAFNFLVRAK